MNKVRSTIVKISIICVLLGLLISYFLGYWGYLKEGRPIRNKLLAVALEDRGETTQSILLLGDLTQTLTIDEFRFKTTAVGEGECKAFHDHPQLKTIVICKEEYTYWFFYSGIRNRHFAELASSNFIRDYQDGNTNSINQRTD